MQVAFSALGRSDTDALVSEPYVKRMGVCGRVDSHGFDTHFLAGPDDAERDLTAIGDQYFFEHKRTSWYSDEVRIATFPAC
jgi:hypothetical protein